MSTQDVTSTSTIHTSTSSYIHPNTTDHHHISITAPSNITCTHTFTATSTTSFTTLSLTTYTLFFFPERPKAKTRSTLITISKTAHLFSSHLTPPLPNSKALIKTSSYSKPPKPVPWYFYHHKPPHNNSKTLFSTIIKLSSRGAACITSTTRKTTIPTLISLDSHPHTNSVLIPTPSLCTHHLLLTFLPPDIARNAPIEALWAPIATAATTNQVKYHNVVFLKTAVLSNKK